MREMIALAVMVLCVGFAFEAAAEQSRYSKALQQACMSDYNIAASMASKLRRFALAWTRTATALTRHVCERSSTLAKSVRRRSIGVKSRGINLATDP